MSKSNLYMDSYGDVWIRISLKEVKRRKDGNIGSWHNGLGLEPL